MSRADKIEVQGVVLKQQKGAKFEVEIEDTNNIVICTISGKLRLNQIKVLPGDKVTVEISPYDLTKGIITWRTK